MAMPTRVLFVCMGNICRSPMAHGVFRHLVRQSGLEDVVTIESAGTHAFHEGEAAGSARAGSGDEARLRHLGPGRAQDHASDFEDFDMILAMDWDNLSLLQHQGHKRHHHKIQLLMRFAGEHESATIPDPYQGSGPGLRSGPGLHRGCLFRAARSRPASCHPGGCGLTARNPGPVGRT